jgi:hypothetical protein
MQKISQYRASEVLSYAFATLVMASIILMYEKYVIYDSFTIYKNETEIPVTTDFLSQIYMYIVNK